MRSSELLQVCSDRKMVGYAFVRKRYVRRSRSFARLRSEVAMVGRVKRLKKVIITPEAIALREIRIGTVLSLAVVCKKLGKSEGVLRHIETGRRDFPIRSVLDSILKIYDVTYKGFRHRVTAVEASMGQLGPKDELKAMIDRLSEDKVAVVMSVVKGLLG